MIFKPDSFSKDWYGFLTNQISHVALGTILTWAVTVFCLVSIGEFPYKEHVFISLAVMYFLYEIIFQGWYGWDTIEDWIFFSVYGAGGTVMTFHEYDVGSGLATFDITAPSFIFPIMGVHLLLGCLIRWVRLRRD